MLCLSPLSQFGQRGVCCWAQQAAGAGAPDPAKPAAAAGAAAAGGADGQAGGGEAPGRRGCAWWQWLLVIIAMPLLAILSLVRAHLGACQHYTACGSVSFRRCDGHWQVMVLAMRSVQWMALALMFSSNSWVPCGNCLDWRFSDINHTVCSSPGRMRQHAASAKGFYMHMAAGLLVVLIWCKLHVASSRSMQQGMMRR